MRATAHSGRHSVTVALGGWARSAVQAVRRCGRCRSFAAVVSQAALATGQRILTPYTPSALWQCHAVAVWCWCVYPSEGPQGRRRNRELESQAGRWRHASSYRYLGGWQHGATVITFLLTRYSGDQGFSAACCCSCGNHGYGRSTLPRRHDFDTNRHVAWHLRAGDLYLHVPYAVSVAGLEAGRLIRYAVGARGRGASKSDVVGITALPVLHQSAAHTRVPARSGISPTPPAWLLPRRGWVELLALFIPYHRMARTPECVTVQLDHIWVKHVS